jgi:hypothetical protein
VEREATRAAAGPSLGPRCRKPRAKRLERQGGWMVERRAGAAVLCMQVEGSAR